MPTGYFQGTLALDEDGCVAMLLTGNAVFIQITIFLQKWVSFAAFGRAFFSGKGISEQQQQKTVPFKDQPFYFSLTTCRC